jgi:hypothetical protein
MGDLQHSNKSSNNSPGAHELAKRLWDHFPYQVWYVKNNQEKKSNKPRFIIHMYNTRESNETCNNADKANIYALRD